LHQDTIASNTGTTNFASFMENVKISLELKRKKNFYKIEIAKVKVEQFQGDIHGVWKFLVRSKLLCNFGKADKKDELRRISDALCENRLAFEAELLLRESKIS
jgi:hypothetical protein